MIYQECNVTAEELFHVTEHGHEYVNPYFGCSEGCPFCYWTSIPGWEGQISVRVNAVDVLKTKLPGWDKRRRLCIGSYCNPYEEVERKYRLTRGILEALREYHIPFVLMTSSEFILDDAELIASMKENATIVFELCRIRRLVIFQETGSHPVLDAANRLARMGVPVLATLSPYLKGITDVEAVLEYLDERIPLYLGELDLETNRTVAARLLPAVKIYREAYLQHYLWDIQDGHAKMEFEEIMKEYEGNPRIRRFPLDISYENNEGGEHHG